MDNYIMLKNCRLVPELTEDSKLTFADVLIKNDKIEKILEPGSKVESKSKVVQTIDLKGKTLLPGLIELHTHLYYFTPNSYAIQAMSEGKIIFKTYEYTKEYLKQGYTTVRDCGSSHNSVAAVRDAINEGIIKGPRLIASGLIVTPTETGNETFGDLYVEADGVLEIRKAVREELKKGNDFIKLMVSGAFMNERGDPGQQVTKDDEILEAVETAKLKDTYVAAHCHGTESIKNAIRLGVRTIEHGTFIDAEGIKMLKDSKDTFMVPTGAIGMVCLDASNTDISEDLLEKSRFYVEKEKACVNNAYNAGLKLGFGSDIDLESFKKQIGYEFIARKEFFNFKDKDILLQATKNSAEIAGIDNIVGTIKEGKIADLIVVDGNPDEDIYVMTKPVVHVICKGEIVN